MKRYILLLLTFTLMGCVPMTGAETAPLRDDPNIQLAIAGAQLTGTAQAWSMQQVAWTVTAQSWTPTPSVTPSLTPSPTLTFTPTVDVTGTMAVEYMNQEIADLQRENVRKEATNTVLAWLPYIVLALAIGLAFFFGYIGAKRLAHITVKKDEKGDAPIIFDVVKHRGIDSDKNPNFQSGTPDVRDILWNAFEQWLEKNHGIQPVQPRNTAERQDEVTRRDQATDHQARTKVTSAAVSRLLESHGLNKTADVFPALSDGNTPSFFPLPEWSLMEKYAFEPNKPFPYAGIQSAPAMIDINENPHVAVIGPTGTGKSRYGLRPFICSAVASRNQVIVIGDMVDYAIFGVHPNVTLVPVESLENEKQAEQYVGTLRVIMEEMGRRWSLLTEKGVSTWERAGGNNTVIVLDELGVAIELLEMSKNKEISQWAKVALSVLVKKGRKAGMNIVFSSQRAIGLQNLLSQVETFVFRVNSSNEERWALGESGVGATDLQKGYFVSRVGGVVQKVGSFQPSDEQVGNFLMNHRVDAYDKPQWIENLALPTAPAADALPEPNPRSDIEQLAETIRGQWTPDMSKRAIGALLGKQYGGAWASKIDQMVEYLKSNQNLEGAM